MKIGLRQWLKQFPTLVKLKASVWDFVDRAFHPRDYAIVDELPQFAPHSGGSVKARARQTILAANQTFPFMVHLLDELGRTQAMDLVEAASLCVDEASKIAASQLKDKFDEYGSDKATVHDYHYVYGSILKNANTVTAALEIGLGTNNRDVVSNMGSAGKPGASLRAFRDFLPGALIYGADVDKRILFEEERIRTFFVDQTDLQSFGELGRNVGDDFDLIIDDGLHSPNANIAVLAFALKRLKRGGWFVVEDIAPSALPVWRVIAALLTNEYVPHLINASGAIVFSVERKHCTSENGSNEKHAGDL